MKFTIKNIFLSILLIAVIISATTLTLNSNISAGNSHALTVIPHNVEYKLEMISKKSNSLLSDIYGTVKYSIDDACDGWSISQNFTLTYLYNNQKSMTESKYFTAWEAKDGSYLQFSSKTTSDNSIKEIIRGFAEKKKNKEIMVNFLEPNPKQLTIGKNTIFPTEYLEELLKHAQEGKKFFNKAMFDGVDTKGALELNSFIGKKIAVKDIKDIYSNPKLDTSLFGKYAWNIRIAFFKLHNQEETPSYEIDMLLHDNGVVSSSTINYKNFAVREYITSLSKVESYCN